MHIWNIDSYFAIKPMQLTELIKKGSVKQGDVSKVLCEDLSEHCSGSRYPWFYLLFWLYPKILFYIDLQSTFVWYQKKKNSLLLLHLHRQSFLGFWCPDIDTCLYAVIATPIMMNYNYCGSAGEEILWKKVSMFAAVLKCDCLI